MDSQPTDKDFYNLFAAFTADGTPLPSLIGNKMEFGVFTLAAGMLANNQLASTMTAEELADAAVSYYGVIQQRLGFYQQHQVHSLEKMFDS